MSRVSYGSFRCFTANACSPAMPPPPGPPTSSAPPSFQPLPVPFHDCFNNQNLSRVGLFAAASLKFPGSLLCP